MSPSPSSAASSSSSSSSFPPSDGGGGTADIATTGFDSPILTSTSNAATTTTTTLTFTTDAIDTSTTTTVPLSDRTPLGALIDGGGMGGLTFALALHARLCGRQLRLRRLPRLGQLAADEQRVSSRSRSRRSINRSRNSPSSFGISLLDDDDRSTPSNHPSGFVVGGVVGFLLPPLFFVFRPEFEFILSLKSLQRRSTHQQSIRP